MTEATVDTGRPGKRRRRLRAAAVAYRRTPGGVEFLLVRTKGRKAWTFPKGHLEPGESSAQAAEREAAEEAGVRGRVDPRPLATYRYPTGRDAQAEGYVEVVAHLMEVDARASTEGPERWRKPAWLGPDEAVARLSENREPEYAAEQARVVQAALDKLTASGP